jgi:hypothetical protein
MPPGRVSIQEAEIGTGDELLTATVDELLGAETPPYLVDKHARISTQPSEGEADVVIDLANLPHGPRILELRGSLLLHPKADQVLPTYPNLSTVPGSAARPSAPCSPPPLPPLTPFLSAITMYRYTRVEGSHSCTSLANSLERILDLEEVPIRREDGNCAVIPGPAHSRPSLRVAARAAPRFAQHKTFESRIFACVTKQEGKEISAPRGHPEIRGGVATTGVWGDGGVAARVL